ncbi:MAG: hypothetical protein Q9196_000256 [Gyalolechia fulgens]
MGSISTSARVALFLALCWLVQRRRTLWSASIPNAHFSSPFASFWIWWIRFTGQEVEAVAALHCRLGPIIRLAPFEISVIGEAISNIYYLAKDPTSYTQLIKQGEPAPPTVQRSDSHQARYQLLYPILRNAIRKRRIRARIDKEYIPLLEFAATRQQVFDAKTVNNAIIFDIIMELASIGQGHTNDLPEPVTISKSLRCQSVASPYCSWKQTFVNLVSNLPGLGHTLSSTLLAEAHQFNGFHESPLTDRERYDQEIQHQVLPRAFEIYDSRVAGYAAVGQTLTLAMQNLSEHRDLQKCLYENFLDNHASASKVPAGRQQPDLCQYIIIETLRLRGRGPLPCVGPGHWGPLGNFHMPAQSQVSIPLYVSHSNPRIFANSVQWDPMRWVDTSVGATGPDEEKDTKNKGYIASWPSCEACTGVDLAMYTLRLYARGIMIHD